MEVHLHDIKSMVAQQKNEKKDDMKQVFQNLKNIQNNHKPTNEDENKSSKLLNLSLEAIASYNYQEKLQRDRIGIIFQKAKTRSWDQYKDYFYQIRGKKNAKQLMDKFVV